MEKKEDREAFGMRNDGLADKEKDAEEEEEEGGNEKERQRCQTKT